MSNCTLFLLSVLEPPVLLNNLTDLTVNISSSVILSCPSEGVPAPTITWYKDEQTLSQGSGKKKKKKVIYQEHANCCCFLVSDTFYHYLQVLWYHQKMGPSILIESQGRTRACIPARPPMRGALQRALPIYGSTVSICQLVVFLKHLCLWLAVFTSFQR